ncbi:MAG: hypothetical protein J7M39_05765 [Anaerolineae bacterium]|nr:hypothetical protein [Anaerolineae bacterium]
MLTSLTLANVLPYLESEIEQLSRQQITDPAHPGYGAVVTSDDGRPSPGRTAALIVAGTYVFVGRGDIGEPTVHRMVLAGDALAGMQRPSGLIDLPTVNIDSSPDTAFTVQRLCTAVELLRTQPNLGVAWSAIVDSVERFIRRAVPGMCTGGFHTPNHRWVIASALAQAQALMLPGLEAAATVEAYLLEGIDVDAEGFFIERSIGVYDAVNTRAWLLLAENWDLPSQTLDGVGRNLRLDLHLLHGDGTAETGLSHRQDYGHRAVPTGLISCYLLYNFVRPEPAFSAAAQRIWQHAETPGDAQWMAYALLRTGDPGQAMDAAVDDFTLHLPKNGIWRLRHGPLSVSAFQDATRLLTFGYGRAMLSGIRIDQTYFGEACGHFISDDLVVDDRGVILRSQGRGRPRRPGYELPLGSEVPPEFWKARVLDRGLRELPPATSELVLNEIEGGVALRYRTLDGMDEVAAQIALDFEPGGIWETEDTRLRPRSGQVLFLKNGWGEMRYGTDVIRIEGGAHAHSMWQMRSTEGPGESVRILLTFATPVTHVFRLTGCSKPDAIL